MGEQNSTKARKYQVNIVAGVTFPEGNGPGDSNPKSEMALGSSRPGISFPNWELP